MRTGRLAAAAAAITFAATFAALALSSDSAPAPREPAPTVRARGGTPTDARIGRARAAVRAAPEDADGYTRLAAAYLQKVRETGDAGYYTRAGEAVDRALALAPGDPAALTERGTLALARHDFRGALRDGLRARRATPDLVRPYGVVADASIELGRYDEAERTLQRMIDLKPDLGSYARVSYFRELQGDLPGAVEAMRLAVSASGGAGENAAHVQTLLGGLELTRGRRAAAARSYRAALQSFRDYAPARAGLARLRPPRDAAHALRGVVARLPLPEHAIALGEAELAAGRPGGGAARVRPGARAAAAAARGGRRRRRRARRLRGGPRRRGARGDARPHRVAPRTERPLGRRARVGPHPRRASAHRCELGAAGAAAGLARPRLPVSRRPGRAGRGAHHARRTAAVRRAGQPGARTAARGPGAPRPEGAVSARCRAGRGLALAAALLALGPAAATAHPLGNFSVNHLTVVRVSEDRVEVRYLLDKAEIPTFQERGSAPGAVLAAARAEVARGLRLRVDGRAVALRARDAGRIGFPPGQGGLTTTRVELLLRAEIRAPRRVALRDATYAGRLGWHDVVVRPGEDTEVRSSVPATEPTRELRAYPQGLLDDPADRRTAELTVRPGSGTVLAPRADGPGLETTRADGDRGFAGLLDDAAAGQGVLLLLLCAAAGWGALHALSPGHGKAMVAAYLVGARGTARHALALGLTVTVTHTLGVFALGLVALLLSAYVLPESLYPWLNLVAGLLVIVVGAGVLRARLRSRAHSHAHVHHDHDHHHHHGHSHDHQDHHDHHDHHDHDHHHHGHSHAPPERLSARGLVALGASAGLIPCPSALVVLLGAIAQHEVALGMVLIAAFSLGLAATLTGLGLAVVWMRGLAVRVPVSGRAAAVAGSRPPCPPP